VRDIGSKSTSGPEAILCAAIDWWLSGFNLSALVSSALETASPEEMWSKRPEDLGAALSHRIPWDRVNSHFWRSAQGVPAVRHMVEFAVRAWRVRGQGSKVQEAKAFVAHSVLKEAGDIVVSSGFLESNAEAIAEARLSRRRVR